MREVFTSWVVAAYVNIAPRTGPIQGDQPKENVIPRKKGPKKGRGRRKLGLFSL